MRRGNAHGGDIHTGGLYVLRDIHSERTYTEGNAYGGEVHMKGHIHGGAYTWMNIHTKGHTRRVHTYEGE